MSNHHANGVADDAANDVANTSAPADPTCKSVDLFGGAMTVSVPSTFDDLSKIRQIPDTQEIYLDTNGFTSIEFGIYERQGDSDTAALQLHLEDIFEEDAAQAKVWSSGEAHFDKLPQGISAWTLFVTVPPAANQRGRPLEPDFVGVLLTMIRLVEQKTDIILTVNVPHPRSEYSKEDVDLESSKWGPLLDAAMRYRAEVFRTFEIRDWDLFVQDEE